MARLLVSTDLSVAGVARSVGWKNQFSRQPVFSCLLRNFAHRIPSPPERATRRLIHVQARHESREQAS